MGDSIRFCSAFVFSAIVGCVIWVQQASALASASDLQFDGAPIEALAQGDGFVFAAVDGPKGIFVSANFGTSWSFASGGSYQNGRGVDLEVIGSRIFAILGEDVYVATVGLTPSWQKLALSFSAGNSSGSFQDPELPNALASDGSFLLVSSNYGIVRAVSLTTLTTVSSSTLPNVTEPVSIPKIAAAGSNWVLAFRGVAGGRAGKIYRTSLSSSGVFGSWNDTTPSAVSGDGGRIGGVFSNGSGVVYVTPFGGSSASQAIFRSDDAGATFSAVRPSGGSFRIRGASFKGSTHIVGSYISFDSGASFTALPYPTTASGAALDGKAMLIDEDDSNLVMGTSAIGPLVTTNAADGASSLWSTRNSGLRGVRINDMAQSSDLSVTVLALDAGIARSSNFAAASVQANATPTYSYPIVPEVSGQKSVESFFAVAVDPDNANIVYAGGSKLYRVTFDAEGDPSWEVLLAPGIPGFNVTDIVVQDAQLVVSFAQTNGGLNGKVSILDKTSLQEVHSGLSGSPVTCLTAVSDKIIYAGVGGIDTVESESAETHRGVFRTLDGGATWRKITSHEQLTYAAVTGMVYDFFADLLYVAGNGYKDGDARDDNGVGDRDDSGNVFLIKRAALASPTVAVPIAGIDRQEKVTAITLATKNGTQNVYVAQSNKILMSNGKGDGWALLYEGLDDDATSLLFFDDLVQASDSGFNGLTGKPNLVVSAVNSRIASASKKKIEITLSKEIVDSGGNRRNIRARLSGKALRVAKKNENAVLVLPRGKWPSTGTVRVSVSSNLQSQDGEIIDSDYDGTPGGRAFRRSVPIKR